MTQKNLNECADPSKPIVVPIETSKPNCVSDINFVDCDGRIESEQYINKEIHGLDADTFYEKNGGEPNYCDPMITGLIVDDPQQDPLPLDKDVINQYSQGLRFSDEAMKKLFKNIVVLDNQGKSYRVPVIWGSQERAVAVAIQENVRKDSTGVVDRIMLPIMSLYTSSYNLMAQERYLYHGAINYKRTKQLVIKNKKIGSVAGIPGWTIKERVNRDTVLGVARGIPVDLGYTLTVWCKYWEDMNQILTQIARKFSPVAYIRIQGITDWETIAKIDSVASNVDTEPGDMNTRVVKFQINFTLETFIPQPIVRRKAVLKTKIDILDNIDDTEIQHIIRRIEDEVGDI